MGEARTLGARRERQEMVVSAHIAATTTPHERADDSSREVSIVGWRLACGRECVLFGSDAGRGARAPLLSSTTRMRWFHPSLTNSLEPSGDTAALCG